MVKMNVYIIVIVAIVLMVIILSLQTSSEKHVVSSIRSRVERGKNVLVLGFYDKGNLGDEAFKTAFRLIFPEYKFTFVNSDRIETSVEGYDAVIAGAGNLIAPYFVKKFNKILDGYTGLKIMFGVSMYPDMLTPGLLDIFDYVYIRDEVDLGVLSTIYDYQRTRYVPDVVYSFPSPPRRLSLKPRIGVFLHRGLTRFHNNVKFQIAKFLNNIKHHGTITFYRYHTSGNEHEDDIYANKAVQPLVPGSIQDDTIYTDYEMIDVISRLDFAIAGRFHSHVMSVIAGTPFISVSSTRKTQLLMTELGLEQYQTLFDMDEDWHSQGFDYNQATEQFENLQSNKTSISNRLLQEAATRRKQLKLQMYTKVLTLPKQINE